MTADERRALEATLGYRFQRVEYLDVALTHRSVTFEAENNEKLEFLGDAVLSLAVSDLLMEHFPSAREGDLSKMRAALVNAAVLAAKARRLDLGSYIVLGRGEEKSGGRDKESILAAGYEAILGAVYLDGGYEVARGVVVGHFAADVVGDALIDLRDYKTRLQEVTQRLFRETPVYTLIEEAGPDHEKHFVSELSVGGRRYGRGEGRSKKIAEQAAAMEALTLLAQENREALT